MYDLLFTYYCACTQVVQYVEYPSGDGFDGEPGHGTHVASSIAGDVYDGWQPSDCPEVREERLEMSCSYCKVCCPMGGT